MTVDAVINSCGDSTELAFTQKLIRKHYGTNVRFFVYEKCQKTIQTGRIPLDNVGREMHTYAHHVAKHYDDLAETVIFTPADVRTKHPVRQKVLASAVRSEFRCWHLQTHGQVALWQHIGDRNGPIYQGRRLDTASPRMVRPWVMQHVGRYLSDDVPTCKYGTFITTRKLLRNTPRTTYLNVMRQLAVPEPEAGHYCERAAQDIFGYPEGVKEQRQAPSYAVVMIIVFVALLILLFRRWR